MLNDGTLQGILLKISKRVLIADMNICKSEGKLRGDTEDQEYRDYVFHYLLAPEYLGKLFQRYPVWEQSLFQALTFYVRNMTEIIEHLSLDRENLNVHFLMKIHLGRSGIFREAVRIRIAGIAWFIRSSWITVKSSTINPG